MNSFNKFNLIQEPNVAWKEGLANKAREAYLERQSNSQNLMKLVYGKFSKPDSDRPDSEDDEDQIGGLFRSVTKQQGELHKEKKNLDAQESSFFENYGGDGVRDWLSDLSKNLIRNCFVTGRWKSTEDAEELLQLDDLSDANGDVYGDFEDLETGEAFKGIIFN